MATIDFLYDDYRKTPPLMRESFFQRMERDYGKGFADVLRAEFDMASYIDELEAATPNIGKR